MPDITRKGSRVQIWRKNIPAIEPLGLQDRSTLGPYEFLIYNHSGISDGECRPTSKNHIIGISGSWHDAAAALFRQEQLVSALEEERITRTKHDRSQFPVHAIRRLLEAGDLRWDDVAHVAIAWDYNGYVDTPHTRASIPAFFEHLDQDYAMRHGMPIERITRRAVPEKNQQRFRPEAVESFLAKMRQFSGTEHAPQVSFVNHHWAHAASAYYPSGLVEPVLVIAIDGYGEFTTTSVWIGEGGKLTHVESVHLPHSLGWACCAVTEYLRFQPSAAEGEVMGLASYGAPRSEEEELRVSQLRAFMEDFIQVDKGDGTFRVDPDFLYYGSFPLGPGSRVSQTMIDRLERLVPRVFHSSRDIDPDSDCDRAAANLAYVFQERIEDVMLNLVAHFFQKDRRTRHAEALALAGGVALNINANGRLIREGVISPERMFVPPAPGDAGTAIGAGLVVASAVYQRDTRFRMRRADYGPAYSDEEIARVLGDFGLQENKDFHVLTDEDEIAETVADLLAQKRIVAWYQGGCEFGPRALGNRSILLNAQDPMADQNANRIKRRQPWRPSAISVMHEKAREYAEGIENAQAPFMVVSFPVKDSGANVIASGRHHADGSTRPQTVVKEEAPLFHKLLTILEEKTGVAAVVNTSFNRSEPIVESPEEAINTLYYMKGVDALVLGKCLVAGRGGIVPTVRSLADEPRTRRALEEAISSVQVADWEGLLALASQWRDGKNELVAILCDRRGNQSRLNWPLVKELFHGRARQPLLQYFASAIYNRAMCHGAAEIFVGSNHPKYGAVLFDQFASLLESQFPQMSGFANFRDPVIIRPLSEHSRVRAPQRERCAIYHADRGDLVGCAIGIDIGASMTKTVVVQNGRILWRNCSTTPSTSGFALCDHVFDLLEVACSELAVVMGGLASLIGVGITVPGVVYMPATGRPEVRWIVDLEANWREEANQDVASHYAVINELPAKIEERYGVPATLLNDVKSFGIAELAYATSAAFSSVAPRSTLLALGTGVGDVLLDRGAIDFGRPHQVSQAVVEFGADDTEESDARRPRSLASILRREHWEALCKRRLVGDVSTALQEGDPAKRARAQEIVQWQASSLARWIAHLVRTDTINEVLLTGGGVSGRQGDLLVEYTNRILKLPKFQSMCSATVVRRADVDPNFGGAMGAAIFGLKTATTVES